ncbi:hypothetical protein CK203_082646 [Vitis vinifera]|uniref:Retrotransposon gag domain-containing protein n=1 Tax=Vitis vinifera TaxID=29760 RepID=A0A438BWU8_VITVI|nr:hypothetical protein CK203_082646 [Vitis vinifera]
MQSSAGKTRVAARGWFSGSGALGKIGDLLQALLAVWKKTSPEKFVGKVAGGECFLTTIRRPESFGVGEGDRNKHGHRKFSSIGIRAFGPDLLLFEPMAGSGDHLNAAASQPAGSGPTREEFANLQQQLNQLCTRLEQAGDFSDEEGGVLPLERQPMFHRTADRDQNLNRRVKPVAIKLKGYASSWWQQVQMTRVQSEKEKIQSWTKMQQQI